MAPLKPSISLSFTYNFLQIFFHSFSCIRKHSFSFPFRRFYLSPEKFSFQCEKKYPEISFSLSFTNGKKKELNWIFKKNSPGKRKKNHSLSENIFQEKFGSHSKTFFHWISHTKKNKFSFHLVSRIRKNKIFCEK